MLSPKSGNMWYNILVPILLIPFTLKNILLILWIFSLNIEILYTYLHIKYPNDVYFLFLIFLFIFRVLPGLLSCIGWGVGWGGYWSQANLIWFLGMFQLTLVNSTFFIFLHSWGNFHEPIKYFLCWYHVYIRTYVCMYRTSNLPTLTLMGDQMMGKTHGELAVLCGILAV